MQHDEFLKDLTYMEQVNEIRKLSLRKLCVSFAPYKRLSRVSCARVACYTNLMKT